MSVIHLDSTVDVAERLEGERVRVIWNSELQLWFIYGLDEDRPLFSSTRLAMLYVGIYGELKPRFAPNGAPSFVGTITRHELNPRGVDTRRLKSHPHVPSKLYFDDGDELVEEFSNGQHALLIKSEMYIAPRLKLD